MLACSQKMRADGLKTILGAQKICVDGHKMLVEGQDVMVSTAIWDMFIKLCYSDIL